MAVYSVTIKSTSTDITDKIDINSVNDCVVHGHKPRFVLMEAVRNKTNKLMTVQCDSEDCSRCCDAYYEKDPKGEIVKIWNKWNPKPTEDANN